jgi:integrase
LGHSSLNVTTETYGHIEDRVRQQEAQQMEGVFAV